MFHVMPCGFEAILQFVDALAEVNETIHLLYLRTDMKMQTHAPYVCQNICTLKSWQHIFHGNAEFIFGQARCDFRMGMCIYIGIDAQGDISHNALSGS